ncbi:MAG: hypothetical protein HC933_19535 [Pleurocapsa sp. SU_196_0]|nr:hypothetical protein [Pleurocapsa sp. SU_196_0]
MQRRRSRPGWQGSVSIMRWLLVWTLLVFSAHHAAPNAPIWTGKHASSAHEHHADHVRDSAANPTFTAVHDHLHSHCELCFSMRLQSERSPNLTAAPHAERNARLEPRVQRAVRRRRWIARRARPAAHLNRVASRERSRR